jgi:hypothetical protein
MGEIMLKIPPLTCCWVGVESGTAGRGMNRLKKVPHDGKYRTYPAAPLALRAPRQHRPIHR